MGTRTDKVMKALRALWKAQEGDKVDGFFAPQHQTKDGFQSRPDIMASCRAMTYDFEKQTGYLVMKEGNSCDMSGCITFFMAIDQHVKCIQTYSGDSPDTAYLRDGKTRNDGPLGNWNSYCQRERRKRAS